MIIRMQSRFLYTCAHNVQLYNTSSGGLTLNIYKFSIVKTTKVIIIVIIIMKYIRIMLHGPERHELEREIVI